MDILELPIAVIWTGFALVYLHQGKYLCAMLNFGVVALALTFMFL